VVFLEKEEWQNLQLFFFLEADLEKITPKGKKRLITAGPTYEAIDPVRL
jgi:phosphopantothenoylcysteine synthetase/decarboxylase